MGAAVRKVVFGLLLLAVTAPSSAKTPKIGELAPDFDLTLVDAFYRINQRHGLAVYAITTEDSVPLSQLNKLFALLAIPSARKLRGNYPVMEGLPTNYVFDRAGTLRYAKSGAFDLDALNTVIIPLLREPAP